MFTKNISAACVLLQMDSSHWSEASGATDMDYKEACSHFITRRMQLSSYVFVAQKEKANNSNNSNKNNLVWTRGLLEKKKLSHFSTSVSHSSFCLEFLGVF